MKLIVHGFVLGETKENYLRLIRGSCCISPLFIVFPKGPQLVLAGISSYQSIGVVHHVHQNTSNSIDPQGEVNYMHVIWQYALVYVTLHF